MRKSFFKPRRSLIAAAVIAALGSTSSPAANVTWVGPNDSFWDLAANWNPGLPLAPDDVLLGAFNTEFRSGSVSIRSFAGTGTLRVTGGTLLFTDASSSGGFFMSAGQLTGAGNLTVTGAATMSLGALSGSGTTTLQGATTISSTGLRLDGGRVFRNEGTVTQTGGVDLNSRNLGPAEVGNGSVLNAAGGTWNSSIAAGTNFILASSQGAGDTGAGATFTNAGTFNKQGAGTTDVRTSFINNGSLNVQAGQLQFGVGGGALTHNGALTIAAGAVLDFAGNGAVTQTINTAATTIAGTLSITNDNFVNFTTPHTISGTGTFQHSFGQVTGANLTLGPTVTVNITDGSYSGAATTTVQGTTSISSTGLRLDGGRIFRNEGTLTQSGGVDMNSRRSGPAEPGNGSVLNAAGGTWNSSIAAGTNFILASSQGAGDTGAGATFTNAGTFNKQGAGTTDVRTSFINNGSLNVQAGQLQFGVGGGALTHNGALTIAAGAVLDFAGNGAVTQTINTAATTIAGTLSITNDNFVNFTTPHTISGTGTFQHSFGQVTGANLTLGPTVTVNITDGSYSGAATTTVQGTTSISSTGLRLDGGRIFRNEGTLTQSGGVDMNSRRSGPAEPGNGSVLNAAGGTWNSSIAAGTNFILASSQGAGDTGAGATFTNAGTFNKQGAGTTDVRTSFINNGSLNVQAGQLQFGVGGGALTHNGALTIAAGAVLDFAGNGAVTQTINTAATTIAGTLSITNDNFVNFTTPHTISGTGTFQHSFGQVTGANLTLGPTVTVNITDGSYSGAATTTVQGTTSISSTGLRLDGGRIFRNEGTLTQSGGVDMNSRRSGPAEPGNGSVLNAAGATWNSSIAAGTNFILASNQGAGDTGAGATFTNAGTFNKQGAGTTDVRTAFNNSGLVDVQAGTLTFVFGGVLQGTTGTLQIRTSGTVQLNSPASTGNLFHNGSAASSLQLGTAGTVTVHTDYNNANFGVGDAFNRRANVNVGPSGPAQRLLAGGDANQGLSGANIVNGNTTAPSITIGNVRVGANTFTYDIANTGTTGPSLRGAIQTGVNGGSITDPRLSGNGVTAGNWGPVATGGTLSRDVTVTVNTAGVFAPLAGQAVNILNNFDNTRSQLLTISSAAGAAAYRVAAPVVTGTLNFGNVLVGSTQERFVTVSNSALADGFSEGLNAAFGSITGTGASLLTGSGSLTNLAAGASDNTTLRVTLNTSASGSVNASVEVVLASNGATTSGLGTLALPSQFLASLATITGQVGVLAQGSTTPTTVDAGNVRIGTGVGQVLTVSNVAVGPAEGLNASFGANTGNVANNGGTITSLPAGSANNTSMSVSLDTSVAGARSGTATVNYVSDGSFNGGVTTPVGLQAVSLQANVFRLANPVVNTPSVTLAARVGDAAPSAGISITNASPDTFTEGLKASVASTPAGFTGSGAIANLAAQGTNSSTLRVALNTGTAGTFSGDAALSLESTGAGTTGAPDLALQGQNVAVSGKVYTPAVASVSPGALGFGIVHVGDTVAAQAVTVANIAQITALNDVLRGSIAAAGPFNATGTLGAGVAAGASDSTSLKVGLSTAVAGVFAGPATLGLLSHNDDMSDLPLPDVLVQLSAQVNNYANPIFVKTGGSGSLSRAGSVFTLDFGNLALGGSAASALGVLNDVFGPADLLDGAFDTSGADDFLLAGFTPFTGLGAGDLFRGLLASFDALVVGGYTDTVGLRARGYNASGFEEFFNLSLILRADVAQPGTVPEPGSLALVALAIASALGFRRRARYTAAR